MKETLANHLQIENIRISVIFEASPAYVFEKMASSTIE